MIDLEQTDVVSDLWKEIFDSDDIRHCYACGACISVCPASTADPPLLIRKLARMVLYGLEEELLDEDSPWSCVTCSRCEEVCPMGVRPFELGLAIRRWQVTNDETRLPPSLVELYKEGYTQPVAKAIDTRAKVGLGPLPTIDQDEAKQQKFRDLLMSTDVVSNNDYMFKG